MLLRVFAVPEDVAAPRTLLSPAQVEKQIPLSEDQWAKLATIIRRPPGKPAIAKADDPRSKVATVEMFEKLDEPLPSNIRDLL
jgi:hypothetical protein